MIVSNQYILTLLAAWRCLPVSAVENLKPVAGWEEVASGVWNARIGEPDKEMADTSLAARPPRIETLNALPKAPLVSKTTKSDQYLWYQGGDTVGVYDLNWHLVATLPVVQKDYAADKGFSEFWIDGQCILPRLMFWGKAPLR